MTDTTELETRPTAAPRAGRATWQVNLSLLIAVEVAAAVVWLLWAGLGGVDLVVGTGVSRQEIGLGSVLVVTVLVTGAALGLRWLLRRRARPSRTWTIVAIVVWAVSFLGPLGAATTSAGLGLAMLHLVVGGGIVFGVRATHGGASKQLA